MELKMRKFKLKNVFTKLGVYSIMENVVNNGRMHSKLLKEGLSEQNIQII